MLQFSGLSFITTNPLSRVLYCYEGKSGMCFQKLSCYQGQSSGFEEVESKVSADNVQYI